MTDYLYIDTETTGLADEDELLSVSIINNEGKCLYHSLIKPQNKTSWSSVESINGITPEMVAHAPSFDYIKEHLANMFRGRHVVAYNMAFDGHFLQEPLQTASSIHCAALAYAEFNGEWKEEEKRYKRIKLIDAINTISPDFAFQAHNSLEDCRALKKVWDFLQNDENIMSKYGVMN